MKFYNILFMLVLMFSIILNVYMLIDNNKIPINNSEETLDGMWLHNYNYSEALEEVNKRDSTGDWVCVNVNGMSYERGVEVCKHEMGHELWAEICEKNDELCKKGQELLEGYSNEE